MTGEEIIRLAVGLAVPLVLAPFAILGLRRLFTIFLTEGVELVSTVTLSPGPTGRGRRTKNTYRSSL